MSVHLSVREHDFLVRGKVSSQGDGNITVLSEEAFDAVEALVLEKTQELNPVAVPTRVGGQTSLKLTQWVGLVRTPDGTTVEILPKTHERPGTRHSDPLASPGRSRTLLLRMLVATDERFLVAPPADLDATRMPLFEVLLRSVLEGIKVAVRRGLPHTYVPVYEERASLRGRLDLPRQMRQPPQHAHRLNVVYDEFLPDRPETRLTRLTVERVSRMTRLQPTRHLARELLVALERVSPSQDIQRDFSAWRLERGHAHFAALEALCRLVLYELNPLVGGITARAHAVLFDMNKVYEGYVAHLLRVQYPNWLIETQVTDHALGRVNGQRAFPLRPDLRITMPDKQVVIADTKWKRLKPGGGPTYDITNADAYQMLAYSHVFHQQSSESRKPLWLIYPHLDGLPRLSAPIILGDGRELTLLTVDLESDSPSIPCEAGLDAQAR